MRITNKQIWRLQWAVKEAKAWIGNCPDEESRDEYRRYIEDAEEALRVLRKDKKDAGQ